MPHAIRHARGHMPWYKLQAGQHDFRVKDAFLSSLYAMPWILQHTLLLLSSTALGDSASTSFMTSRLSGHCWFVADSHLTYAPVFTRL